LRDELLHSTTLGEQYRALYEQHSGRATQLLLSNPALLGQGSSILLAVTPGVAQLLDQSSAHNDYRLSAEMVAQMQTFLNGLAAADRAANLEAPMAAMIETEMAKINWDALVDMTVAEAWDYLNNPPAMQYKLYLPLIQ
ncbi:MAG: hypothetical protein KDE19_14355, partial [Caldilineaceae bacterium]|nr:hypothetical protein [Caldilineaceae bacterium]